jgi:hypothetical protein
VGPNPAEGTRDNAPGSNDRAVLVRPASRGWHSVGAPFNGRLLCRQGRRDFGSRHDAGSSPARPTHACLVVVAARILGKDVDGVQFSGQALHVTVVSAASTRPCQGLSASSNLAANTVAFKSPAFLA